MKLLKFIFLILAHAILVGVPVWIMSEKFVVVDTWLLLSMKITYNYYVAQRALLAGVTVAILAIIVSSIADRILVNNPDVVNNIPRSNITMSWMNHMQLNIVSLAIGIRLLLAVFLGIFWYSTIMDLDFSITGVVIGIEPISIIFLIFFPIIIIASSFIIVFEPWQSPIFSHIIIRKSITRRTNLISEAIKRISMINLFALGRAISYALIYLLLAWFTSAKNARDATAMLISTIIFIIVAIGFWLHNRRKNRLSTSKA